MKKKSLQETYQLGISRVLFFSVPAALVFIFLGVPIIELLLKNGKFDDQSVAATYQALFWFGLALIPKGLAYFHYRILHASLRSWTQVSIGMLGVLTNASLNYLLYEPYGLSGIAAATAISLTQSMVLAVFFVYQQEFKGLLKVMIREILKPFLVPFILVGLILFGITQLDSWIILGHHKLDAAFDLALAALAAIVVIFVFRWQCLPEIENAKSRTIAFVRKLSMHSS